MGSSEEYVISENPLDENTQLNANNPYGISKVTQEQFAKLYREQYVVIRMKIQNLMNRCWQKQLQ